jgi:hypothetical protein
MNHLKRITPGLVLVIALTTATVGPHTSAFAERSVDPSTLNPPPPAEFNPVCKAVGDGTICDVTFIEPPVTDEPSGIQCGSGADASELLASGTRSVDGKRYYDDDGNLTRRHFHDLIVGSYTNPLTGASAPFRQHDTIMHDLAVAGDITTGTEAVTVEIRVSTPRGGTVLIDAGRTVGAAVEGTPFFEAGQHPFDAYFIFGDTSALQPICDALK